MRLDQEQLQAVNALGTNILVRASAGAGKTGVLIARIEKRCVKDHVDLSRILAITFTKAAAAEMRQRLAQTLHKDRAEAAEGSPEAAWLDRQLTALPTARIMTIDSFCLSLIEKYGNVIALDPAIARNLLTGGAQEVLERQAFAQALAKRAQEDSQGTLNLCMVMSPAPGDYENLFQACRDIHATALSLADPEDWFAKARKRTAPPLRFTDFDVSLREEFLSGLDRDMALCDQDLEEMKNALPAEEKEKLSLLAQKHNLIVNCRRWLQEGNYGLFRESFQNLALITVPTYEGYKKIRDRFHRRLNELAAKVLPEELLVKEAQETSVHETALLDLAELYGSLYQKVKEANRALDMGDLETDALAILNAQNGETAALIRSGLDEILVDEFQDTSVLQNTIIEKVSNGHNVFRVGDVKQSIYRFRQASPDLMRGLMQQNDEQVITLRHNYRSCPSIIAFTNSFFTKVMNVDGFKDHYDEADCVSPPQKEGGEEVRLSPAVFFVNVLRRPEEGIDSEASEEEEETPSAKQAKAAWIASRLQADMAADPRLHYRDFAVLLRSNSDKKYLREAFERAGIPYDLDAREGFYQSRTVQEILSLVRAVENPESALDVLAVAVSPFYDMDDDTLAAIRLRDLQRPFLDNFKEADPGLFHDLQQFGETARAQGLNAFFAMAAAQNDFYERLDDRGQANFDALLDKVNAAGFTTLAQLQDLLENAEEEVSAEAVVKSREQDLVPAVTIHYSKGLQYKRVFLWSSAKNLYQNSKRPVLVDPDLGIALPYVDLEHDLKRRTLPRMALETRDSREELEEFVRLLYVAVTRAVDRLYIVDALEEDSSFPRQPVSPALLYQRRGITGLLLATMPGDPLFAQIPPDLQKNPRPAPAPVYPASLPHYTGPEISEVTYGTPSGLEESGPVPSLDLSVPSEGGTSYGTVVHAAAEQLPNTLWTKEDVDALHLDLEPAQRPAAEKALLTFGSSDLYRQCLALGEIHKEFPFYCELNSTRMHGSMDFVAIGQEKIILIDFKTDHKTPAEIKALYSAQLNAYRAALKAMYNRPVEAYAWSFHNSCAIVIDEEQNARS